MPLTEQERGDFLSEALDSKKVQIYCKLHNYFGPSKTAEVKPNKGCAQCWMVFYFYDIATAPPHTRAQRLDELTEVVHKAVELAQSGKWDINIDPHANIKIESE